MSFRIISKRKVRLPFTSRWVPAYLIILAFGFAGFLLPLISGFINGFPYPHVQDELSYTLAADTYAHFRVTNPTPDFYESFEAPHVIVEPSYISKYPPGQGLFMAAGKLLFGHFIYGVWLSCGLMAAALFWMLLAWTRPTWAFAGTILMILIIGVNAYWAQSYWGGMVAASGGALFFGGYRRLFRKLSPGSAIWMTIGGVILANSRPFEGTVTMILPLAVLLVWLFRTWASIGAKRFAGSFAPAVVIAVIALSAMLWQYYRVTGSPFTLPYAVHHSQYYPTPLFLFQSVNDKATRGNARLRRVFESYTSPPILEEMKIPGLPYHLYLSPVYGLVYLSLFIPVFFLSPFLLVLVLVCLPGFTRRSRWLLLIIGTIAFTFLVMSLGIWWDQYHYSASLTCCFYLLAAEGIRHFYVRSKKGRERRLIAATLFCLAILSTAFQQIYSYPQTYMDNDFTGDRVRLAMALNRGTDANIEVPTRGTFFKAELEKLVETLPDRYLAIVSYSNEYSFHDEIVFNGADLSNERLLWAHDLGGDQNAKMAEHYGPRKILLVRLEKGSITVRPTSITGPLTWSDVVATVPPTAN